MKTRPPIYRILFVGLLLMALAICLLVQTALDPPYVNAQKPGATATPRVVKPSPTPAPRARPPVRIPRNDAARLPRLGNLGELLAQGAVSDPLAGNYTLVNWDRIGFAWIGTDDPAHANIKMYAVTETLSAPIPKAKSTPSEPAYPVTALDLATGYLRGDPAAMDLVAAYAAMNPATSHYDIALAPRRADANLDFPSNQATLFTGIELTNWELIRIATGDVFGVGYDQVVLAWEGAGGVLWIKVYKLFMDLQGAWSYIGWSEISDEHLGGNRQFDLATGDFNGDGKDEIALAWQATDGYLYVKTYSVDSITGKPIAQARVKTDKISIGAISVAAGDLDGKINSTASGPRRVDDLVVGFLAGHYSWVQVFQVADDLQTLTAKGAVSYDIGNACVPLALPLSVATGDMTQDGIDDIAFAYAGDIWSAGDCHTLPYYVPTNYLRILQADGALGLHNVATRHAQDLPCTDPYLTDCALTVAVGDVNRDLIEEVVIGYSGANPGIRLFQATLDANLNITGIVLKGEKSDETGGHAAVALGSFDGQNLRVGTPSKQVAPAFRQAVAVIHAPPKHQDAWHTPAIDINVTDKCVAPPCTFSKFEQQTKQDSKVSWKSSNGFNTDVKATHKFPLIKGSLDISGGKDWENFGGTTTSLAWGTEETADFDDLVVYSELDMTVWEYPIYTDTTDQVQSYFIMVFTANATINHMDARQCDPGILGAYCYLPAHEVGNILSYPWTPTNNLTVTNFYSGNTFMVGSSANHAWFTTKTVTESGNSKTWNLKVEVDVDIGTHKDGECKSPLCLDLKGDYHHSSFNTAENSYESETSLHMNLESIELPAQGYQVKPRFGVITTKGTTLLDYGAYPNQSWWASTYNKPDPAVRLPYRLKWCDPATDKTCAKKQQQTWDITFDPPLPKIGDLVTLTAKIHNFSPTSMNGAVTVRLCADGVGSSCRQIGADQQAHLANQATQTLTAKFTAACAPNAPNCSWREFWVWIDPGNRFDEMHKQNNQGWAVLAFNKKNSARAPNGHLTVVPGSIALNPATPIASRPVEISALIRAQDQPFNYVRVEIWDGHPRNRGRLIGAQNIPAIAEGATIPVSFVWNVARGIGAHDLWVGIPHAYGTRDLAVFDNWIYAPIQVGWNWYNFPVIGK